MNIALIAAIMIGGATLIGAWHTLRSRTERRRLRSGLQLVAAVFLYLVLFPPSVDKRFVAGTLVVITPGATREQAEKLAGGAATVALPGTEAPQDIERAPDLGTALRRHPDSTRLRVVGGGLPLRDIDAARALSIDFDASPLPHGIIDISAPANVRAGSTFAISGRIEADAGGRVELRDPAGAVVARAVLAGDGSFTAEALAKTAGNFVFALRVLDAAAAQFDEMALPIAVEGGDNLRVMVLAGAPDPELKYLRRWATDAGIDLSSRIVLSDGIAMQDGEATLSADALAKLDLVLVDERAWKGLDANAKNLLKDATREGLGLFLRVGGPVPESVSAEWRDFGFRVRAADVAQTVSLEHTAGAPDPAVVLTRRALIVDADEAAPLLRDADGSPLALWRSAGRGRVAIWWLADAYRVALAGDAGQFGSLWSRALATVARARGIAAPQLPTDARVDQRSVFCGIDEGAFIEQPDGAPMALSIETTDDSRRCAAYWPIREGWHALVSADRRHAFYVSAANAAPALVAARAAEATRARAGSPTRSESAIAARALPAPRWPFFAAWLAAVALLWWLERTNAREIET